MPNYLIYTDGAARSNPGPAAASFIVISKSLGKISQKAYYLGKATNNEAEYWAIKEALNWLKENCQNALSVEVEIRTDSQLIANQLLGKYRVKDNKLKVFYNKIKHLEKAVGKVTYNNIPRCQNKEADHLANQALDEYLLNHGPR